MGNWLIWPFLSKYVWNVTWEENACVNVEFILLHWLCNFQVNVNIRNVMSTKWGKYRQRVREREWERGMGREWVQLMQVHKERYRMVFDPLSVLAVSGNFHCRSLAESTNQVALQRGLSSYLRLAHSCCSSLAHIDCIYRGVYACKIVHLPAAWARLLYSTTVATVILKYLKRRYIFARCFVVLLTLVFTLYLTGLTEYFYTLYSFQIKDQ